MLELCQIFTMQGFILVAVYLEHPACKCTRTGSNPRSYLLFHNGLRCCHCRFMHDRRHQEMTGHNVINPADYSGLGERAISTAKHNALYKSNVFSHESNSPKAPPPPAHVRTEPPSSGTTALSTSRKTCFDSIECIIIFCKCFVVSNVKGVRNAPPSGSR